MTDRELLYTGLKEFLPEVSEKMIDDLLKFSALLLEKNKVMNLTAVTEPTEVVTRHFLDCAALAPHTSMREFVITGFTDSRGMGRFLSDMRIA